MTEILTLLQKTTLFESFPEDVIQQTLLPNGQRKTYPKGSFLLEPQQQLDRFGVVLSGRVHTLHLFQDGSASLTKVLTPGQILGFDLICTRSRRAPYHAEAVLPTEIFYLPTELLTEPGLLPEPLRLNALNQLLLLVSQENMKKEYRLAILAQKGLRERITTYLTMQAGRRGTQSFSIPFSRDELADFLCVNRSALSHELGNMRREGLIDFHKNNFTLYF